MTARAALAFLLLMASPAAAAPAASSCTACHADREWFGDAAAELMAAFAEDVHVAAGLSCHDCHGGNPDPALAADFAAAMDPAYPANPYRGAPSAADVPGFCGRCHSDPVFMRRFQPDARVDAEREYRLSQHGRALAAGDTEVATCVQCHGAHGILPVDDGRSPVHPTRVAETCAHCHADAARMAGRLDEAGRPLPVDQYAAWRQSVHAEGLLERGDLSSPTCNDCHGNHGARPPGVDELSFVCGQCHGREAALFRESDKASGFREHNALLDAVDGGGCGACHAAPEPQATLTGPARLTECGTCHDHHRVLRPSLAGLSPLPEAPCEFCHGTLARTEPWAQEPAAIREHYESTRDALLGGLGALGPEARFDFLVDRLSELAPHRREDAAEGAEDAEALRPTFARLRERFRIGRIHPALPGADPGDAPVRVVRCGDCHAPGGPGFETSRSIVARMQELTTLSARAERVLAAARRGGVEVQGVLLHIDKAVDAQIELEVLVHAFHAGGGSAFDAKQAEGISHAESALVAGHAALDELDARRRGLGLLLSLVVLVLVALGLVIRRRGAR